MAILKTDTISGIGTEGSVFDGDIEFTSQQFLTLPKGNTEERGRGTRAVFNGASDVNVMDFVNIQNTANAVDFGDALGTYGAGAACSSRTRGIIFVGFDSPTQVNIIEFITFSTTGNAQDFGDLTQGRRNLTGFSNQTRGIAAGGSIQSPAEVLNIIDFITIASAGNATDFGDAINPLSADPSGFSSPTRGVIAGGESPSPLNNGVNVIQFVTIASTGNTTDFGDLTTVQSRGDGASSQIRGVIYSGKRHPTSYSNIIEFVTIATTGNAADFGDAATAVTNVAATSNSLRGVFGGGYVPGSNTDDINYLEIQSMGNSVTFGNLTVARREFGASSEAHGGLD